MINYRIYKARDLQKKIKSLSMQEKIKKKLKLEDSD